MEILQALCYSIIIAVVPVITPFICKFLATKWQEIRTCIKSKELQDTLDHVVEVVTNCVINTNQTFVDSLKKSGQFTKEAAETAFNLSKDAALKMLTEEAKETVKKVYGDLDTYLDILIESKVNQMKQ